MQRSRVLRLYNVHSLLEFVIHNKFLIIFTLFFLTGIFIGVFTFGSSEPFISFAENNFALYISERTEQTFAKIMLDSFFENMLYLVVCFILGSSMLGTLFLPLFLAFKGFLYGQTAALMYSVYSLKGIAFHTLLILPVAVIFSVLLIFAARESMRFSVLLVRVSSGNNTAGDIAFDFKNFCIKYLIFSVIAFLCAVMDSLLSFKLINSFSL